jgi:NAD dependent epimerase/dehydratase family enzyme
MSWIALADLVRIVERVIADETLRGPVNAVAPDPVTNAEFTKTLARVVGRPAFLAVPAVVLRSILGSMADELLLSGARVIPARLHDVGFGFEHAKLEPALRVLTRRC